MAPDLVFPDVRLRGPRLVLRPLGADDVDDVALACTDDITQRWLPLPRPYTRQDASTFCGQLAEQVRLDGRGLVRAIELHGRLVGVIDLKRPDRLVGSVEVGYWTAPWARGQGVMTEAVLTLTTWVLRDQGLQRVELRAATGNTGSLRVAEKAGFQREGVLRRAGHTHDGPVDLVVLSRLADDGPVG